MHHHHNMRNVKPNYTNQVFRDATRYAIFVAGGGMLVPLYFKGQLQYTDEDDAETLRKIFIRYMPTKGGSFIDTETGATLSETALMANAGIITTFDPEEAPTIIVVESVISTSQVGDKYIEQSLVDFVKDNVDRHLVAKPGTVTAKTLFDDAPDLAAIGAEIGGAIIGASRPDIAALIADKIHKFAGSRCAASASRRAVH